MKSRITEFRTEKYQFAHGRKPRTEHGHRASWLFELSGGKFGREIVQTYGTYTEAKAQLKKLVRENVHGLFSGSYVAEVLP